MAQLSLEIATALGALSRGCKSIEAVKKKTVVKKSDLGEATNA